MKWIAAVAALAMGLGVALIWGLVPHEDYSTPRSAAETFYIALMTGDMTTARRAVADPQQAELLDDLRGMVEKILAAREAARERFGESANSVSGGMPSLEDLATAAQSTEGERGAVVPVNADVKTIRLLRVGEQWRVDLFGTFDIDPSQAGLGRRALQLASQAMDEHVESVKAGRYRTAGEIDQALQDALKQSIARAAVGDLLDGFLKNR